MSRYPPRDVIDLETEEDTDGQEDSDNSLFDNCLNEEVSSVHISPLFGRTPGLYPRRPRTVVSPYDVCLAEIVEVFPDISREHVKSLYNDLDHQNGPYAQTPAQILIEKVLDGGNYPKEKDRIKELKRKRSDRNSDEEEAARWKYAELRDNALEYSKVARVALHEAFEFVPSKFINEKFKEHSHYYGTFFAILEAERAVRTAINPPYAPLKARRVTSGRTSAAMMVELREDGYEFEELKREIDSAQQRRNREEDKLNAAEEIKRMQEAQDQEHRARGEVMDCGCCFDTVTILKITHCNGDEPHFFCLDCAQQNANTDIGNSRYGLRCMDGSGCTATFSRQERERFLDAKSIEKIERLQQQDDIRLADLQNLCTCPFCDFAAICPPIEEDKEFRCHNPECEEVSCRLCKAKSHIPLSCDEFKRENGVSERRIIEEARTEALIRTCGKCKVRILKEDGCNKVICTKCYAVLCDYCGKDITKQMYNHFDGQGRAPPGVNTDDKTGKCPLYDESHKRKDQQVDKAEKEAMAKVRAEHPDLSEEDLKIKFAEGVQSSSSRHHGDHHHHVHAIHGHVPPHHNHHHRHHGQGLGEAAMAALYNREPGAALDAMFEGVGDILDEFGGLAPHAIQQAREQGRQAREQMRAAHQQAQQQQLQYQREALIRQHQQQQAAHLAQQQATLRQREAQREDLQRRSEQARRIAGLNQATQTHRARMAAMDDPVFARFLNGPQAADVLRPRQNDQAFGNNAGAQNVSIPDDIGARRQPDSVRQRNVEERLRGLGGAIDLDSPTQRREVNNFHRRTAAYNAGRTAARVAEGRPYDVHSFDPDPPPPRMPGGNPLAPRRRDPMAPGSFNPWVTGANDQAYL